MCNVAEFSLEEKKRNILAVEKQCKKDINVIIYNA